MNFANVGGLAATVGDAVAMFALRIEVSAATLPVAALLSRAGYEVLGFWLVCQLGRIMCSAKTSIHEGIVLSHPSTHFWLLFCVEALSDWRYKIYSS